MSKPDPCELCQGLALALAVVLLLLAAIRLGDFLLSTQQEPISHAPTQHPPQFKNNQTPSSR